MADLTTDALAVRRDFARFFANEHRAVLRLAYALTGEPAAAEDITQEAFLAALRHWQRVAGYADAGVWVRRVAANLAVSRWRRLRSETRALDEATADAETLAALGRLLRRQRRVLPFQLAVAATLVLALLVGALLLSPGGDRREVPAGPPPTTVPKAGVVRTPPSTATGPTVGSYPIPPGPPFPRVAASAFPPLFDSAKVRALRQQSTHPLAFPTWLPDRFRWELATSQALDRLSDYRLQPVGAKGLEIEVFHDQVSDGRSTDPLDRPVKALTMPNGLKVFPYQDMVATGTDAYIVSDRHEFVVVYFHGNCGGSGGACLTRQERWRFVRGLAMVDRGR